MGVGLSFTDAMHEPSGLRRNYTHVPVTSVSLAVDPSGRYEGFPHFVSFAERIKWVLWGQAQWGAGPGKQMEPLGLHLVQLPAGVGWMSRQGGCLRHLPHVVCSVCGML